MTALSTGNHAIAVAHAARELGTTAKVVMPRTADPARIEMAREQGAEGRFLVHPFEGPWMALGSATLALELSEQVADLDAVLVPVGGGGLAAGIASAMTQLQPRCRIFGVEPSGADSMRRSFAAGSPQPIEAVRTIADSLGAPFALPYSFALCRENLDGLAGEPAGAAAAAALLGPLRETVSGTRVVLIVCGANLSAAAYARLLSEGPA